MAMRIARSRVSQSPVENKPIVPPFRSSQRSRGTCLDYATLRSTRTEWGWLASIGEETSEPPNPLSLDFGPIRLRNMANRTCDVGQEERNSTAKVIGSTWARQRGVAVMRRQAEVIANDEGARTSFRRCFHQGRERCRQPAKRGGNNPDYRLAVKLLIGLLSTTRHQGHRLVPYKIVTGPTRCWTPAQGYRLQFPPSSCRR